MVMIFEIAVALVDTLSYSTAVTEDLVSDRNTCRQKSRTSVADAALRATSTSNTQVRSD